MRRLARYLRLPRTASRIRADVDEELRRTVGFVSRVRQEFPEVVISVDTWRHE